MFYSLLNVAKKTYIGQAIKNVQIQTNKTMSIQNLQDYTNRFLSLRRGNTPFGLAPHKPVLLLAIFDWLKQEEAQHNIIQLDKRLFDLFRYNWKLLVKTKHTCKIDNPIYHLQNENLWSVTLKNQRELKKARSQKYLVEQEAFGQLESALFELCRDQSNADLCRMILLDAYFPDSKAAYISARNIKDIGDTPDFNIIEEPQAAYGIIAPKQARKSFIRNWKFRAGVMHHYNYTCSISRMKIDSCLAMIEAAHIKPFHKFGDNSWDNGLALSPTFHRAFDWGLISVDKHYKILVQKNLQENKGSLYALSSLKGQKIFLPDEVEYYPSLEKLEWHRDVVFLG